MWWDTTMTHCETPCVLCVSRCCPVSVALQPSLHAAGREGAPGPGGVSEEHEEPHGDLQVRTTQAAQEGPQPEEGARQAQTAQLHSDWLPGSRWLTGVRFVPRSGEDRTPRRTAATSPGGTSAGMTKVCGHLTSAGSGRQCRLSRMTGSLCRLSDWLCGDCGRICVQTQWWFPWSPRRRSRSTLTARRRRTWASPSWPAK